MLKNVTMVHEGESVRCGLIKLHDQFCPTVANLNRVLPTSVLWPGASVVLRVRRQSIWASKEALIKGVSGSSV